MFLKSSILLAAFALVLVTVSGQGVRRAGADVFEIEDEEVSAISGTCFSLNEKGSLML